MLLCEVRLIEGNKVNIEIGHFELNLCELKDLPNVLDFIFISLNVLRTRNVLHYIVFYFLNCTDCNMRE